MPQKILFLINLWGIHANQRRYICADGIMYANVEQTMQRNTSSVLQQEVNIVFVSGTIFNTTFRALSFLLQFL